MPSNLLAMASNQISMIDPFYQEPEKTSRPQLSSVKGGGIFSGKWTSLDDTSQRFWRFGLHRNATGERERTKDGTRTPLAFASQGQS